MMSIRKRNYLSISCRQNLKKWQRNATSYSKETMSPQGAKKCNSKETETQARYDLSSTVILKDTEKIER